MQRNESDDMAVQLAKWIDDLGGHAEAADAIALLGDAAIPALESYLAGAPQTIPQARCFAVAMLARLHAEAATSALRTTLHAHPLKTLDPRFAESEYVVKSDALVALCKRSYPQLADDIGHGIHERLRAAVAAAGTHGLSDHAGTLVDMLDDDVLAAAAVDSLTQLGPAATAAIAPRLDAWLVEAEWSVRRRLALLRALQVLRRSHTPLDAAVARHAAMAKHPVLRAAAALWAWPAAGGNAAIDALVHGAVGCDRDLADACREALQHAGRAMAEPIRQTLQRNAEPDLYGNSHPLSAEQRGWLAGHLRDSQGESR